jgi:hypothetical protein
VPRCTLHFTRLINFSFILIRVISDLLKVTKGHIGVIWHYMSSCGVSLHSGRPGEYGTVYYSTVQYITVQLQYFTVYYFFNFFSIFWKFLQLFDKKFYNFLTTRQIFVRKFFTTFWQLLTTFWQKILELMELDEIMHSIANFISLFTTVFQIRHNVQVLQPQLLQG